MWMQLESTGEWLFRNPPDGTNASERRKRMAVLQRACDELSPADSQAYVDAWEANADQAEQMEKANPALRYLRAVTVRAMGDIRHTRVKRGVVVWFLYNMGYVFKTPTACFGIDLCGREVERLAPDLDFLLVSHEHADHFSAPLVRAMIDRHRPVLTRSFSGPTVVNHGTSHQFGEIHVKIDPGDHHREDVNQRDNMMMFEVDCGRSGNNAIIYHSGDGNNYEKMHPEKPVDLFIVHVEVGMSVPSAIGQVCPKVTFVSHVLELGHSPTPPNAWRWSYEHAFGVIRDIPEREAMVLTWGERRALPGTLFQEADRNR